MQLAEEFQEIALIKKGMSRAPGAREAAMSDLSYDLFPTALGWIAALASPRGLRRLAINTSPERALDELGPADLAQASHAPLALETIRSQIEAYCRGEEGALDSIALDLEGAPPFFRAAWEACRAIPHGETRSYAWLAAAAGRPGAFRAAGQAMARNRLAVVVPCHRVIGSDGGLHGYGGGLDKKASLLDLERRPGKNADMTPTDMHAETVVRD